MHFRNVTVTASVIVSQVAKEPSSPNLFHEEMSDSPALSSLVFFEFQSINETNV
jgi:hypothetical protein